MARFVFGCIFAFAFLMNATLASAASASCDMGGKGAVASMQHDGMTKGAGDPCCDHASKKACAQACATVCATVVAIANSDVTITAFPARVSITPAEPPSLHSSGPGGLDPPPRSIA